MFIMCVFDDRLVIVMDKAFEEVTLERVLRPVRMRHFNRYQFPNELPELYERFTAAETVFEQVDILCEKPKDDLGHSPIYMEPWEDLIDPFLDRVREATERLVIRGDMDGVYTLCRGIADEFVEQFPNDKYFLYTEFLGELGKIETSAKRKWQSQLREWERDEVLSAMRDRAREQFEEFIEHLGELNDSPPSEGVHWNGTLTQLAYLLYQLRDTGLLGEVNIWALAERVFVQKDGSPVKRTSMKSIANKHGFKEGGSIPRGGDEIDRIVETLINGLPQEL